MIIAELQGKIPSKLEDKEDILTSHVFSFLKYSNRQLLKDYLSLLELDVTLEEARNAEFNFWIKYDDRTEPDLVIVCGKYYILFEAKLYSDFSPETLKYDAQIIREIKMGKQAAENEGKDFVYIAITAEYYKVKTKYSDYEGHDFVFKWTNWQAFTSFIENKLIENDIIHDKEFASDLYSLLVKKRLRSYKGISSIKAIGHLQYRKSIFYDLDSSKFKGEFTGFVENLRNYQQIKPFTKFYNKTFFKNITLFDNFSNDKIFYNGSKS
jgi:hypothetical protein